MLEYNSLVKNWLNRITKITHAYAFHIDSTTLPDGMYELVPEPESEQRETQVNLIELTEDLNQSSEEPKASSAQEGKPRSMSNLIQIYATAYIPIYLCI